MIIAGLPIWKGGAYLAIALVGGVLLHRRLARKGPEMIELFEEGLVQRAQGATTSMHFDDVVRVISNRTQHYCYGVPGVRTEEYVFESIDGRRIRFNLMHDRAPDLFAAASGRVMPPNAEIMLEMIELAIEVDAEPR
jgi:hypothetical protein